MVDPTPKKKNNTKFNIVDFLIILILVLCLASIVFRYTMILDKIGLGKNLDEYEISFTVSDLRYTTPSFFHIDDVVYLSETHQEIGPLLSREDGSVDALTIMLSSRYVSSENGFVASYFEENSFVDATGRILCQGRMNENGYFYLEGDTYLAVGQKLSVCTEQVDFEITVTDIRSRSTSGM